MDSKAWRSAIVEEHEKCDIVAPYPDFATRYKRAKGAGDAGKAEQDLEKRIARQHGLTYPARVSGDVMAREKERYLEGLKG